LPLKVEGEFSFCPGEVAVFHADTAINREYEWYRLIAE
jgi:hypothetical protein